MTDHPGVLLLGVCPEQDLAAAAQAAALAEQLGAELHCAWVDPARYTVQRLADGTVRSAPIDPEVQDQDVQPFPELLRRDLATILEPLAVVWRTHALAGNPSAELSALAKRLGARMIVVGARRPSLRTSLHELLGGSVAAQLARCQLLPVLVVPAAQHP
ncbi:universal stress protein [Glutamicibacter protophormiae]|uniref:universal stress protein n=1 Tax=Glutamicibacter protophormiae TaxID=37930 RepID=UPI003A8E1D03